MVTINRKPSESAQDRPISGEIEPGRRIVGNTLVQFATPALRLVLGLVLAAALSRYLGVGGFGAYALVFAVVATFSGVFNDWGLSTICLREVAQRPSEQHRLIAGAATLQLLVAVATYALMGGSLLLAHYPGVVNEAIAIYGLSVLMAPLDILALPFQADLRLTRLLAPALLGTGLNFSLSLAVIYLHGGLALLVVVALFAVLAQYAWVTRLSFQLLGPLVRPNTTDWGAFVREAWPLGIMTVLTTALQQAPILALSFSGLEAVGLFNAANKIPAQLFVLPLAIRVSTFPLLARSWATDRVRFRHQLRRLVELILMIAIPALVVGIGLAGPLVTAVYGRAFSASATSFAILMVAFALMAVGMLLGEALIAAGYQRVNLGILAGGVPLLGLLLLVLVPRAGITGAAIAVAAGNGAILVAVLVVAQRYLGRVVSAGLLGHAALAIAAGALVVAILGGRVPWLAAALGGLCSLGTLVLLEPMTIRQLWRLALPAGAASA